MTESPGRRRARLSGGEVALIVVVATLVVVFLAMLLGRLTADGTPTASPTPEALSTAAPTAGPTTPGASTCFVQRMRRPSRAGVISVG